MTPHPRCPTCNSHDVFVGADVGGCQDCTYSGPAQHFFAHVVVTEADAASVVTPQGRAA